MDVNQIIARFDEAERAFYSECAELTGETLAQWVSHMDEIGGGSHVRDHSKSVCRDLGGFSRHAGRDQ